jgi:universal stress protein A
MKQRILCPVDFSATSRSALRVAGALARDAGGTLTVLFVNDPLLTAAAAAAYDAKAMARTTEVALRAFVRRVLGRWPALVRSTRCLTAVGRPAREIVKAAKQERADLVVMGTHGLTGVRRLILGSVTEEVLRTISIPVLAVPHQAKPSRRRS